MRRRSFSIQLVNESWRSSREGFLALALIYIALIYIALCYVYMRYIHERYEPLQRSCI